MYVPVASLPRLSHLPVTLRPQPTPKTALCTFKPAAPIDGNTAQWGMLPYHIGTHGRFAARTMGFAGVGQGNRQRSLQRNSSRFAVGYNAQGLLLAVWVSTPEPMHNDANHWWIWRGDCVRLYIATLRRNPWMDQNHFQIGLAPVTDGHGPPEAVNLGMRTASGVGMGGLIPGAKVAAQQGHNGWSLEAMVPWSYFGRQPHPGAGWGFDLQAGGHTWNGGGDDWSNPTRWGVLRFAPMDTDLKHTGR